MRTSNLLDYIKKKRSTKLSGHYLDPEFEEVMAQLDADEAAALAKEDDTDTSTSFTRRCADCGEPESLKNPLGYYISKVGQEVDSAQPGGVWMCKNYGECKFRSEMNKALEKHNKDKKDDSKSSSSNGYQGYQGSITKYVEKCRHNATPAFFIGDNQETGVTYYGGSQSKIEKEFFAPSEWVVVSLLGYYSKYEKSIWAGMSPWKELSSYGQAPTITIEWPDYGAPPVNAGFWSKLNDLCKATDIHKVLFYCVGGHGRTGTALSSVLVEVCGTTPKDAVKYVRDNYCKEAVESESQVEYLMELYKTQQQLAKAAKKGKK